MVAACCVFFALWNIITHRGERALRGDVWVQQLLKAANVPMKQFLDAVGSLSKSFKTSDDFAASIQTLKQQFVILVIIYTKFRKLWERCWQHKYVCRRSAGLENLVLTGPMALVTEWLGWLAPQDFCGSA